MSARTLLLGATFALAGLTPLAVPAIATEPKMAPIDSQEHLLTLEEALARALRDSPGLAAADAEVSARDAEVVQGGRLPNPELSVEVENVAGSGDFSGTDAAETTIQLNQLVELGGKRKLRRETAALEREAAAHGAQLARAAVVAATTGRFFDLLAAQEREQLSAEQTALAQATLAVAEERIAAGKAPAMERLRFQALLAEARLAQRKAAADRDAARRRLAASWGTETPTFTRVVGDLHTLPPLPSLAEAEALLAQAPEAMQRQLEVEGRQRALALAEAGRLPDPTFSVGWRNFQETDDNALVLGIALPLPLFDRRQGERQAAASRLALAQAEERGGLLQSQTALAEAWQALAAARAEAQALDNELVPAAQQTFDAVDYGYRAGKFGVLEVQDAQRTLFEVRQRHLEALTAAHRAAAELERVLGRPLPTPTDKPSHK